MARRPEKQGGFFRALATFIVDKRNAFFLLFAAAGIFCIFSQNWTKVNNSYTSYLPADTETRRGIDLMAEEFTSFGSAEVMIGNISYADACAIADEMRAIKGVSGVEFSNEGTHYKNASALFSVTFEGEAEDGISIAAIREIKEKYACYDLYVVSEVDNSMSATVDEEMKVVTAVAVIIIVSVLLLTSKTYAEVPVLLATFGMAALLNMGTNFIFGEISFITDSIAIVLQLALAIDYAIILCHRYTDERKTKPAREATIDALTQAIPEIAASSLTTVSGLLALMIMQFKLGYDMGIVLSKAIVLSLVSVFFLMPGLLMVFSKWIDKTHHKNFIPDISAVGRFDVKSYKVVPIIFLALIVGGYIVSGKCNYVYGYSTLDTIKKSEATIATRKVADSFDSNNVMAVIVPSGDYEKEAAMIADIENLSGTKSVLGLANVEAMDGYTLTSKLRPREFAELTDIDIEIARLLYAAYAVNDQDYGRIVNNLDNYKIPLIDLFLYLYETNQEGYVTLDKETNDMLESLYSQLSDAKLQLESENYSRIVVSSSMPEESDETFVYLDELHGIAEKYYDDVTVVGNSTSDHDLAASFENDNRLISILSIVFVITVLVFTFKSAGLPVLLIAVIQGSIWLNFSFPPLTNTNMFFLTYLIVSAIQMGANIDYAIVVTNRYHELKRETPKGEAMIQSVNQAFPTIITSGLMLAAAGFIICFLSSDCAISSIGLVLGRGTLISICLVLFVLPQILLLGDVIIEKSSFSIKAKNLPSIKRGNMKLDGHVKGYVNGVVDADVNGSFSGTIDAAVSTDKMPDILPYELRINALHPEDREGEYETK